MADGSGEGRLFSGEEGWCGVKNLLVLLPCRDAPVRAV